jgi:hypothetical protein
MIKDKISFLIESVNPIEEDRRFANIASQYEPKEGIKYFAFTFHGTTPLINRKGMAITLPTHKNSLSSAIDTQVDYEHISEDIGDNKHTEILGHICSLYIDEDDVPVDDKWIIPSVIPSKPVITRGVMALFTRMESVNNIAQSIRDGDTWYFSLEIGRDVTPPEIWVASDGWNDDVIYTWAECPDDLKQSASEAGERYWNGRKIAYLMGGRNGRIQYIGGALTKRPAGYEQDVMGNPLKYICSMSEIPDADNSELKYSVWESIKEVPDRLKTMDGVPLTIGQINWIARIAEGVGTTKDVNGWAVAKSRFKDGHTIKNGRWVKKHAGSDDMKDDEVRNLKALIEKYRTNSNPTELGEFEAILIEDWEDLRIFTDVVTNINGGENMPNLTDDEYADALAKAKQSGLDDAMQAGTVVSKELLDAMFTKEQVDAMVKEGVAKQVRETKIASLPLPEQLRSDLLKLTSDCPYDVEGDKQVDDIITRWSLLFKSNSEEGKKTSSVGDEASKDDSGNFNPGSGDGQKSEDIIVNRIVL